MLWLEGRTSRTGKVGGKNWPGSSLKEGTEFMQRNLSPCRHCRLFFILSELLCSLLFYLDKIDDDTDNEMKNRRFFWSVRQ